MCNTKSITGLDYSYSDMTIVQIYNFIQQLKDFGRKNIFETIGITGGEPLLHPDIEEITFKLEDLRQQGYFANLVIGSNKVLGAPENLRKYIINFSSPKDNKNIHNTSLIHPNDFGGIKQTYDRCNHHRKNRVVLTYQGYSICCAADAYIRLFCMDDLILDYLPKSLNDFPLKEMDKICEHCPFGNENILPFERDRGCPISNIYEIEANKNKLGRKILKRFAEKK